MKAFLFFAVSLVLFSAPHAPVGQCDVEKVRLRDVGFDLYTPHSTPPGGDHPRTVLVLPPTGGENVLDRGTARSFCAAGLRTAVLNSWTDDRLVIVDWAQHDNASKRALKAVRETLDWLGEKRVGILGTSLGGIYASLAMAGDPRIAAAVLIVTGGPLADVLVATDQKVLLALRHTRCREFGVCDPAAYTARLRQAVKLDPPALAVAARRGDVLMYLGGRDTTVPTAQQRTLWQAWGEPRSFSFPHGHFWTIVRTHLLHRGEMAEFFVEKL